ncbi:MAG: TrbG/VirB9 family P-type conjugative transfer protein [Alphaproteobacteria bacterium]|nr:TrbG/VirB9 family P-type conjugative transfer protein [Alphaproteobacteria bacterium]
MNRPSKRHFLLGTLSVFIPIHSAYASTNHSGDSCRIIHWQPDQLNHLQATMDHATHVILPKKILGQPIVGNRELWNVEGQGTHLFIKPNSDLDEGKQTTVTVINLDNESYDFVVSRADMLDEPCIRITHDGNLITDNALEHYTQSSDSTIASLKSQITTLQTQMKEQKKQELEKIQQEVSYHRQHIYTLYSWDKSTGWLGSNAIDDIWDDGRFTYIRMTQDNKGLFTISATLDKEESIIEYTYDASSKIYQIAGIFAEFKLKTSSHSLTVTRKNANTRGSY